MHVNYAYHAVSTPNGWEYNGNDTIEVMLVLVPWLRPLVTELQAEEAWSRPYRKDAYGWSALFCVENVDGVPTKVVLEMKPSRANLVVPAIPLTEDAPVSINYVQSWVLANVRRDR